MKAFMEREETLFKESDTPGQDCPHYRSSFVKRQQNQRTAITQLLLRASNLPFEALIPQQRTAIYPESTLNQNRWQLVEWSEDGK